MNLKASFQSFFALMTILVFAAFASAQERQPREWVDVSGTYKITATFERITNDTVFLKKSDGSVIDVPISMLSANDQEYLEQLQAAKPAAEPTTINSYLATERKILFADKIATFYAAELANPDNNAEHRQFIEKRLNELKDHVQNNAVLIKGKFLTPTEIDELHKTSDRLIDEWYTLIEVSSGSYQSEAFKQAQRKIDEARRVNPVSFRADFYLGLANIFIVRDFKAAERHFDTCVQRGREYQALFGFVDKSNFAHALNNLALLRVRRNRLNEAENLWNEMLTIVPKIGPEVAHNIQRVVKFIEVSDRDPNKSYLQVTRKSKAVFHEWHTELALASALVHGIDSNVGWLYLPYIIEKTNAEKDDKKKPLPPRAQPKDDREVLVGFGSGFVIKPGFVLTNRHVVEDKGIRFDKFRLFVDSSDNHFLGTTLAVSDEHDLAIISCPDLTAHGIPFRTSDAKLGEEILVAGFPLTQILGNNLTVTKGVVSQMPNDAHDELVIDAKANGGNSGGPIFDRFGNAIAVLNAGYIHEAFINRLSQGITSVNAVAFIQQHINGFVSTENSEMLSIEEILDSNRDKIVRIEILINKDRLANVVIQNAQGNGRQAPQKSLYRQLEDRACFVCSGHGQIRCPNTQCKRGRIKKFRLETFTDPSGNWTNTVRVPYYENCPTCGGDAIIDCWGCSGGVQNF